MKFSIPYSFLLATVATECAAAATSNPQQHFTGDLTTSTPSGAVLTVALQPRLFEHSDDATAAKSKDDAQTKYDEALKVAAAAKAKLDDAVKAKVAADELAAETKAAKQKAYNEVHVARKNFDDVSGKVPIRGISNLERAQEHETKMQKATDALTLAITAIKIIDYKADEACSNADVAAKEAEAAAKDVEAASKAVDEAAGKLAKASAVMKTLDDATNSSENKGAPIDNTAADNAETKALNKSKGKEVATADNTAADNAKTKPLDKVVNTSEGKEDADTDKTATDATETKVSDKVVNTSTAVASDKIKTENAASLTQPAVVVGGIVAVISALAFN